MIQLEFKALLDAGVHFGHLTRKWHPKMAPFIFMKQNGIHIIDLHKTMACMQEASSQLSAMAQAGKKILFVATKKQIKASVEQVAKDLGMPYVTERWLGGTLTNFVNTRKLLKRMLAIEKNMHTVAYKSLAKKERLVIAREQEKLSRILQGLANVTRLPSALLVIDIKEEHIAVEEARKLGIPVFALVDTNTNPDMVDFPIPGNDDACRSVDMVVRYLADAIKEGIASYKKEKVETAPKKEVPVGNGGHKMVSERSVKVVQGVVIKQTVLSKSKFATPAAKEKVIKATAPLKNQSAKAKVVKITAPLEDQSAKEKVIKAAAPLKDQSAKAKMVKTTAPLSDQSIKEKVAKDTLPHEDQLEKEK